MKNRKKPKRRPRLCPACKRGRILDEADTVQASNLQLYGPEEAEKGHWFVKCPNCKAQIGLAVTDPTIL